MATLGWMIQFLPDGHVSDRIKCAGVDIRVFADHGGFADHPGSRLKRAEMANDRQIGFEWLFYYQQGFPGRDLHRLVNNDKSRRGLNACRIVFGVIDEYQIAFLDFMDLINAGSSATLVTNQFGAGGILPTIR